MHLEGLKTIRENDTMNSIIMALNDCYIALMVNKALMAVNKEKKTYDTALIFKVFYGFIVLTSLVKTIIKMKLNINQLTNKVLQPFIDKMNLKLLLNTNKKIISYFVTEMVQPLIDKTTFKKLKSTNKYFTSDYAYGLVQPIISKINFNSTGEASCC